MKKNLLIVILIFSGFVSHAQNQGAYLIPRQVFVGDPAVFVFPLPAASGGADVILTSQSPDFPSHPDIDFRRIILERRTSRLLIEFTAFVPGILELPVIKIGNETFSGLTITVNSLIDSSSSPVLSGPASSLAMPGTAAMIYGTMAGLVFLIFLVFWFTLKGKVFLKKLYEKYKRWQYFLYMKTMEKRFYKAMLKGVNKRIILDNISERLRSFLSYFTGFNCLSMTAFEFEKLPLDSRFNGSFLVKFFRFCDELRFSGTDVKSEDISRLLSDLSSYIQQLSTEKTS
jgi:hypothetical protein